jgi:hypothetical protein
LLERLTFTLLACFLLTPRALVLLLFEAALEFRLRRVLLLELLAEGTLALALIGLAPTAS